MDQLPEGTRIHNTTKPPSADAERYEWVPDESKTFDQLDASVIFERSRHVSNMYEKYTGMCIKLNLEPSERDEMVRQLMLAADSQSIDFSRRFPRRFKQLTDHVMAHDPIMQRHQNCMLEVLRQKQSGELSEERAKQLVAQLAQQTILDCTNALAPDELARRRAARQAEREAEGPPGARRPADPVPTDEPVDVTDVTDEPVDVTDVTDDPVDLTVD
jgi:hypothetical protein